MSEWTFVFLLIISFQPGFAEEYDQKILEVNQPFIRNFTPREYDAFFQNWSITQDQRGLIYVGNGYGVLEYDRLAWRTIPGTQGLIYRAVAVDEKGVIYAAGLGNFGFLESQENGALVFRSLTGLLPPNDQDVPEIWKIHAAGDRVHFISLNKTYIYCQGKIAVMPIHVSPFSSQIQNDIFIQDRGLMVLNKSRVTPLPRLDNFSRQQAGRVHVLPYERQRVLIVTEKSGFFLYDLTPQANANPLHRFPNEVEILTKTNQLYCVLRLIDGNYALGTLRGGLIIMNPHGRLVQKLDKKDGLQSDSILDIFQDRLKNLWLGLNNGISCVELASGISHFDDRNGLGNTVTKVFRHQGELYVGTYDGAFKYSVLDPQSNTCFQPVGANRSICAGFLEIGNAFFSYGIEGMERLDQPDVPLFPNEFVVCCAQTAKFPDFYFLGLREGLAAIRVELPANKNENKKLSVEKYGKEYFPQVNKTITSIFPDDNGNLWLNTEIGGIIVIHFTDAGFRDYKLFSYRKIPAENGVELKWAQNIAGQIIIGTGKELYTISHPLIKPDDFKKIPLTPATFFGPYLRFAPLLPNVMSVLDNKDIIAGTAQGIFIMTKTSQGYSPPDFSRLKTVGRFCQSIYSEKNGITWFCTNEGLFRYNPAMKYDITRETRCLIRRVKLKDGQELFNGSFQTMPAPVKKQAAVIIVQPPALFQPSWQVPRLEYKKNSLTFEYTCPSYEQETASRFSYYLEGFDETWSSWSERSSTDYTNLREGKYRFMVKAANDLHQASPVSQYNFIILPPWYRTIWAYCSYVLMVTLGILMLYRLHLRRLEKILFQEQERFEKNYLTPEKVKEYVDKLIYYIDHDKPYLNPDLTVQVLSEQVKIPRYQLSQIINHKLNMTFFEFINMYRIKEAQRILQDPQLKSTNILDIAYDVGFYSKSSFNVAFRKQTNTTPSRYRKIHFNHPGK